jgi:hypothetical protein
MENDHSRKDKRISETAKMNLLRFTLIIEILIWKKKLKNTRTIGMRI